MAKHTKESIYDKNIEILKEKNMALANKIECCSIGVNYEMRGTGKGNFVNVYSKKIGKYYYDEENPTEGVKKQLSSLNIKNAKIAVFLGFGLGLELEIFAREYSEKSLTRSIVVIEKDIELFKIALHMFDYSPLFQDDKIELIIGENVSDMLPILTKYFSKNNRIMLAKAIFPIYIDSTLLIEKEYYLSVLKEISSAVPYVMRYYGNSPDDSLIGVENMLENIDVIIKSPGINLLYNKFNNKPAIIVATGPSLSKNKMLLKGLEDKALIISVDASLKILKDEGITPHLVTSLERIPETAELMSGFKYEDVENVYYAACPVIPKEAYEAYPGPRVIVYRNFDHFKWIELEKGILEIKHSSANMGFKIAEALGCNPIILIGQDLAYSREGKSHASGAYYGEEQGHYGTVDENGKLWTMGNDGELIQTHMDWEEFRKAYEVDIASYQGVCINATEGGAFIGGTEIMTLQEAIHNYIKESFYPLDIIRNSFAQFTVEDEKRDLQRIKDLIDSTKNDLFRIQEICKDAHTGICETEEYYNTWMKNEDKKYTKEFSEELQKNYNHFTDKKNEVFAVQPTMQLFMMHIFQPYYIKLEMECHEVPSLYDTSEEIQIATLMLNKRFFSVLHDLINVCNQSLDKACEKINGMKI